MTSLEEAPKSLKASLCRVLYRRQRARRLQPHRGHRSGKCIRYVKVWFPVVIHESRCLSHSSCWPGLRRPRSTPKKVSATTSPRRIESEHEGLGNRLGKTRGVQKKLLNVFPLQKRTPWPTVSFAHCQAAGFSRYGFYILKNMLSGFSSCCRI